jgi:hypothetical protein
MTDARSRSEARHAAVRAIVAAILAGGAAVLTRQGGAPWSVAIPLAAGAAAFAAWRTVAGACGGFLLMLLAALAALGSGSHDVGRLGPVLPALAGLELLGPATVVAVARARHPRKVSRRLLGAWLASSGLVAVGLALATRDGARAAGGALLAGALAYRLGVVPAYAWAPMLLRHPSRRISATGVLAAAASAGALALTMAHLPEPAMARLALVALAGSAAPWAAWQARHQWRRDPACAKTYAVVALMSLVVLLLSALHGLRGAG